MAGQVVVEVTYESPEGDQIAYKDVREVSDDLHGFFQAVDDATSSARTHVVLSALRSGWIR